MDMEVSAAVEDDLFFADLSQRISLLITEDDEDFPVMNYPVKVPFQVYNQANQPFFQPSPSFYEASYRRETKGTGVFIPKSSFPKRKKRSGRSRQNDNKANKASSAVLPNPTNTTTC